jgi:hypothetical protein
MDALVEITETFMRPSAEYPDGSYMQIVGGKVTMATGYYATLHPDKPSPYWHGKAPFFYIDTSDWPWKETA